MSADREWLDAHNAQLERARAGVREATMTAVDHCLSAHDAETLKVAQLLLDRLIAAQRLATGPASDFEAGLARVDATDAEIASKLDATARKLDGC